VLNVSGHRIGTAEVESALVAHESVAEAAVVSYPHDIKGEGIYAYVVLKPGVVFSERLQTEMRNGVRHLVGAFASPDIFQDATNGGLPKTRSGKIMRRILRKIAHREADQLGDISTLQYVLHTLQPTELEQRLCIVFGSQQAFIDHVTAACALVILIASSNSSRMAPSKRFDLLLLDQEGDEDLEEKKVV
jgi:hypothetical protein